MYDLDLRYIARQIKSVMFFERFAFECTQRSSEDKIASITFLEGQDFTYIGVKESCTLGINCIRLSILILLSVLCNMHTINIHM